MSGAVAMLLALDAGAGFDISLQTTRRVGSPSSTTYRTYRTLTAVLSGGNVGWTFAWSKTGGTGLMNVGPTGETTTAEIVHDLSDPIMDDEALVTMTATQTSSGAVVTASSSVSLVG